VRNSWVTKPNRESAGFIDAVEWEKVKGKGDAAIKSWIDDQLKGTSVTVVLIGSETASRDYVSYEIEQSYNKSNAMIGIYIHNMKTEKGLPCAKGKNPFDNFSINKNGKEIILSSIVSTYNWVDDDGYNNLGTWIENAKAI
jgi:hypothetical protein